MPYHCNDCHKYFSVRKGTAMQSSKLGYRKWVIAIYMMTIGIKGTSRAAKPMLGRTGGALSTSPKLKHPVLVATGVASHS